MGLISEKDKGVNWGYILIKASFKAINYIHFYCYLSYSLDKFLR